MSYKKVEIQLGATVNGMARRVENARPGNKVGTLISTSHSDEALTSRHVGFEFFFLSELRAVHA